MKSILFVISMITVAFLFTDCSGECKPRIIYRDRIVKVNVPVKCKVPKVDCDINESMSNTETIIKLVECIVDLKQASRVCQ